MSQDEGGIQVFDAAEAKPFSGVGLKSPNPADCSALEMICEARGEEINRLCSALADAQTASQLALDLLAERDAEVVRLTRCLEIADGAMWRTAEAFYDGVGVRVAGAELISALAEIEKARKP